MGPKKVSFVGRYFLWNPLLGESFNRGSAVFPVQCTLVATSTGFSRPQTSFSGTDRLHLFYSTSKE